MLSAVASAQGCFPHAFRVAIEFVPKHGSSTPRYATYQPGAGPEGRIERRIDGADASRSARYSRLRRSSCCRGNGKAFRSVSGMEQLQNASVRRSSAFSFVPFQSCVYWLPEPGSEQGLQAASSLLPRTSLLKLTTRLIDITNSSFLRMVDVVQMRSVYSLGSYDARHGWLADPL